MNFKTSLGKQDKLKDILEYQLSKFGLRLFKSELKSSWYVPLRTEQKSLFLTCFRVHLRRGLSIQTEKEAKLEISSKGFKTPPGSQKFNNEDNIIFTAAIDRVASKAGLE